MNIISPYSFNIRILNRSIFLAGILTLFVSSYLYAQSSESSLSPVSPINPSQNKPSALDNSAEKPTQNTKALPYRLSVSVFGFVNGSFISKPKSKLFKHPINQSLFEYVYPGFGGVGGGGGGYLEAGWKAVHLGLGFYNSSDSATGDLNGQTLTLSQTTSHLPITVRFELPSGSVRPSIFGGPEWVSVSDSTLEIPPVFVPPPFNGVQADSYFAWHFGVGLDFLVTKEIRVPLRLRGVYAPMDSSSLEDRVDITVNEQQELEFTLKSIWEWQAQISLGVSYDFYSF